MTPGSRLGVWSAPALGLLVAIAAAAGCGPTEKAPGRAPESEPEEIDRLRSLPYVGYAAREGAVSAGVTLFDEARSSPGYNLYTIHHRCRAELIDARGRTIRAWEHQPSSSWSHARLLPDGDLVVVGWDASEEEDAGIADAKRYLLRFAWDGTLRWKRSLPAHHDVEVLPDGSLLTLTFVRRKIPAVHPTIAVRDDHLTFLDPSGTPVRSLSFYDMATAAPALFPLIPVAPNTRAGEPWIDLFHGNSVQVLRREDLERRNPIFRRGNVVVCFRHQNRIAIVDPREGRIVWTWGRDVLSGPHDAQVLDTGRILVFDNGIRRRWSRVLEIDPADGEIVWTYEADPREDFFTLSRGACQRLPNGNTLIAESDAGAAFEVTPSGEVVWRFGSPHLDERGRPATIARMKRYEPAFVDALLGGAARAP